MTREEALKRAVKAKYLCDRDELINEIYDYFESRICENCVYYDCVHKICCNKSNENMLGFTLTEVDDDFGCNKFKRRK